MENQNQNSKKKGNPVMGFIALAIIVAVMAVLFAGGKAECRVCHGSGNCTSCNRGTGVCRNCTGTGVDEGEHYGDYELCYSCNGTGICTICMGSGECGACDGKGKK